MLYLLEATETRCTFFFGRCFPVYNILYFTGLTRLGISVFHSITNGSQNPNPRSFTDGYPYHKEKRYFFYRTQIYHQLPTCCDTYMSFW